MKLYNINTDKIENVINIRIAGTMYAISDLGDEVLNQNGYYRILYNSRPDNRYYTYIRNEEILLNVYTITYTPVDRLLVDVQHRMADDLRDKFDDLRKRPKVDTGLGFFVYGGISDIEELIMWKDYAETEIIDADGNIQVVNGVSYTGIATAIKDNRRATFQKAKQKVNEIKALISLQECINYENEPYDSIEEITDELGIPTGEGTHTVTRHKNNILDWE